MWSRSELLIRLIFLDHLRQRVVERLRHVARHIMRLDVHRQPAFGGAIGHPLFGKRIRRARPLKDHERREFPVALWLRDLPVHVRAADVVELDRRIVDVGDAAFLWRDDGVHRTRDRAVSTSRPRMRRSPPVADDRLNLRGIDCRAENDDAGATRVDVAERLRRAGWRPNLDANHPRRLERRFDSRWASSRDRAIRS